MKQPNKQLLEDLLEDSASPEFRAAVMAKTLRSARQRKRMRHFSIALGAAALVGIFAFAVRERPHQVAFLNQTRPQTLIVASKPPLNDPHVISTKPDSTLAVVQTTESDRPREIGDKELVTLLSSEPVALVRYASGQAELISLNQNN